MPSNVILTKSSLDEIREGRKEVDHVLYLKLKDICDTYNFYPGVFYHEGNINEDGPMSRLKDLNKYDGFFMIVDAPDIPIQGFKGVELRPSITKGVSDNQLLFIYTDYSHLKQLKHLDFDDEPSVWFAGDFVIMENGQIFPQQNARYMSVVSLATCGLNTQIDLRMTQFIQGSFHHISGRRLNPSEYYHAMSQHPYGLAVRGWGNYSARFYELLASGRIPVHIDTGDPLPFENEIDWDQCIVNVNDLRNIRDDVNNFHNQFTDDKSFRQHQDKLVKLYHEYCSVDGYIKHFDYYEDDINRIIKQT